MSKEIVQTTQGRHPLGQYSLVVRAGGFAHIAGQIGWDFVADTLVEGGIEEEARQALANLRGLLDDAGLTMVDVVKVTVYLVDMDEWPVVNTAFRDAFPEDPPARTAVEVKGLPVGARVELDAVAVDG